MSLLVIVAGSLLIESGDNVLSTWPVCDLCGISSTMNAAVGDALGSAGAT